MAFIARKTKDSIKIYQDVLRPDILRQLVGLDKREKLGFLQLQALVGITKFDANANPKKPLTIQTDSHGIIRKTFLKLTELGYLQNYEETYLKDSHLILPKLAFGNTDIKAKAPIYNMRFQRTEKTFDFDDPEFQKMFPMIFAKRGILEKCNYEIQRKENGEYIINYSNKTPKNHHKKDETSLRDSVKFDISLDDQKECVERFFDNSQQLPPNVDIPKSTDDGSR